MCRVRRWCGLFTPGFGLPLSSSMCPLPEGITAHAPLPSSWLLDLLPLSRAHPLVFVWSLSLPAVRYLQPFPSGLLQVLLSLPLGLSGASTPPCCSAMIHPLSCLSALANHLRYWLPALFSSLCPPFSASSALPIPEPGD